MWLSNPGKMPLLFYHLIETFSWVRLQTLPEPLIKLQSVVAQCCKDSLFGGRSSVSSS